MIELADVCDVDQAIARCRECRDECPCGSALAVEMTERIEALKALSNGSRPRP